MAVTMGYLIWVWLDGQEYPCQLQVDFAATRQDEQAWHKRFACARVRGEWFRPTPELLKAIDDLKASIEENLPRILQKLQQDQEDFLSSGGRPRSAEEIEHLRVLQWQEEHGAVRMDN